MALLERAAAAGAGAVVAGECEHDHRSPRQHSTGPRWPRSVRMDSESAASGAPFSLADTAAFPVPSSPRLPSLRLVEGAAPGPAIKADAAVAGAENTTAHTLAVPSSPALISRGTRCGMAGARSTTAAAPPSPPLAPRPAGGTQSSGGSQARWRTTSTCPLKLPARAQDTGREAGAVAAGARSSEEGCKRPPVRKGPAARRRDSSALVVPVAGWRDPAATNACCCCCCCDDGGDKQSAASALSLSATVSVETSKDSSPPIPGVCPGRQILGVPCCCGRWLCRGKRSCSAVPPVPPAAFPFTFTTSDIEGEAADDEKPADDDDDAADDDDTRPRGFAACTAAAAMGPPLYPRRSNAPRIAHWLGRVPKNVSKAASGELLLL